MMMAGDLLTFSPLLFSSFLLSMLRCLIFFLRWLPLRCMFIFTSVTITRALEKVLCFGVFLLDQKVVC